MAEKNAGSNDGGEDRSWVKSLALLSTVVTDIVGCTAAGAGLGWFLNTRLGWPSFLIVLFAMAGLGVAFYHIYLVSQRLGSK